MGNPTAVVGVLAVAEARRMNWTTLRPVDTHWPVRDHLMETGRVRTDVAPDTDVQSAPSRPTNLDIQVEQYLNHLIVERGLSANTLAAYRRDLTKYTDFCHAAGITKAQDISGETVTQFAASLAKSTAGRKPLASASISRIISGVRGFHRFLLLEQVTAVDPSHDLKPQVPRRRLPKALRVDEVLAMLAVPNPEEVTGIRDRALLEFLYATGARVSEVLALDVDDLDEQSQVVRLQGKGGKQRLVPIGSHARDALAAYLDPGPLVAKSKRMGNLHCSSIPPAAGSPAKVLG